MRVEVEVSDLVEGVYYIDKKCENLEKIVRRNPVFAKCVVKRQSFGGDWKLDPFVIQDTKGNDLVSLQTCEVDELNESELQSFIDVQVSREQNGSSGSGLLFLMILIVVGPSAGVFSIATLSGWLTPYSIAIALSSDTIVLFSIARFYLKRRKTQSKKRHIDLVAARENSSFLSAMRKLASSSEVHDWIGNEYIDRLHYIEDNLGD